MIQVISLVLPLFSIILLGYLAGRWRRLPVEGLAWLNVFILYIALPAMFFRLLARTPMEEFGNARFLFNTTLATFVVFWLCVVLARLLRRGDIRVAAIQGFAGAYGNIGYLGPPLAISAFGPEAGVPVALIFCLDNSMHFVQAPLLMAVSSERRGALLPLISGILQRIFTHPFILATLAGVAAAAVQFQPPAAVDTLLQTLANAAAPCALFAMGVTAAMKPLKRIPLELTWLVPIKLLLHPLLMYLLVSRLPGVPPVWLHVAVLMAALPSATNVFVLAQQYGIWEERASASVVISTVISTVTVTTYIYLAQTGVL